MLLIAFATLRKATINFVMFACLSAWNNSAPTGRIFIKFDIGVFSENPSRLLKFHYNRIRITSTLHEDKYAFFIISRSVLHRMRNISDKSSGEKPQHTCDIQIFFLNRTIYDILRKIIVQPGRAYMTKRRKRIACWIPKVTKTHSEYVILIAFPLHKWLHEGASMLR